MEALLTTHILSTTFMCGLCWYVQLVHYPGLLHTPIELIANLEQKLIPKTGMLVVPVMTTELITGALLLIDHEAFLFKLNIIGIGIIALSTLLLQGPIHLMLTQKPTTETVQSLIKSNWVRTITWTGRVLLLAYFISRVISL